MSRVFIDEPSLHGRAESLKSAESPKKSSVTLDELILQGEMSCHRRAESIYGLLEKILNDAFLIDQIVL